jgi:hypothetical protein
VTKRPPSHLVEGSLAYWANLMTARGHAAVFARNNRRDKRIVERSVIQEWVEAVEAVEQLPVTGITEGPENEFPDFYVKIGGQRISIELTELLHSRAVLKSAAKQNLRSEDVQWTAGHFRMRVQECARSKSSKLASSHRGCDVLILHTDEPWLLPHNVERWLAEESIQPLEAIRTAYLIMTYVPGWSGHWPIFRLWGAL